MNPGRAPCVRGYGPVCRGCNSERDLWCCHCGTDIDAHAWEEHGFVPLGCICYTRVVLCDPRDRGACTSA